MSEKLNNATKGIASIVANPLSIKIITLGVLTLLLLKPAAMIRSLIEEREQRQTEVVEEISSKWGRKQTVIGPIISVPYQPGPSGEKLMHFLPKELEVSGVINPKVLRRGIFDAVVYNADLRLKGEFTYPDTEKLKVRPHFIDWERATISLGVSDVRGIKDKIRAKIDSRKIRMNPGLPGKDIVDSGVSARLDLDPRNNRIRFDFNLNLAGSERISFIPIGESTIVKISSDWPSPNFDGAYLPNKREVSPEGFKSQWKVLDLNRNYPQQWIGNAYSAEAHRSAFNVGLVTPVDFYQKSMRTTKYAVLFVVLIFTAFFISEITAKVRLHPVQYLLIGAAVITFYILLLSLSEHIDFSLAYFLSSVSVIALVTLYAWSALQSSRLAAVVGGVLTIVYTYLYWLLQMVDYALLAGSIGLFAALSVIMWITRKVDWYSIKAPEQARQEA
jgi:inner membrane protein